VARKKKSSPKPKLDLKIGEDLVDEDIDSEFPEPSGCGNGEGVQFDLYMIRATYSDTSEEDPYYVVARHEEEAMMTWHLLNVADLENSCELTVTKIQSKEAAHER
jgi:hypothetical protein